MNTIKYINPLTKERKSAKCRQPRPNPIGARVQRYYPTMPQLDVYMLKLGFVRAGKRWSIRAVQEVLRLAKEQELYERTIEAI